MLRQWYYHYFKRKLFFKLIVIYSFIAVASLVTLAIFAYMFLASQHLDKVVDEQRRIVESMNQYFNRKVETSQDMVQQLYQDSSLINDTIYFLENGYENYLKYRLDMYSSSNSVYLRDFREFYHNQFWKDTDIENIILFSDEQNFAYIYGERGNSSNLYEWKRGSQENPEFIRERYRPVGSLNKFEEQMDTSHELVEPYSNLVSVVTKVNSPQTLTRVGAISIDFNTNNLNLLINSQKVASSIIVTDLSHKSVYTSPQWDQSWFPNSLSEQVSHQTELIKLTDNRSAYVMVSQANKLNLKIVALLPEEVAAAQLAGLRSTIVIVTMICILVVLITSYVSVTHISRRTVNILRAMKKVQAGNLNVQVLDPKEDELGVIANSFNRMVDDLKLHINQVYKSELKQKNAELVALQSQINPHFLYNTLEVIRMRAVSKGAQDVGEMIYNLASIFKHMVKDATLIPIEEEIQNCKRYLELTRIRYRDKLQYSIQVDADISGYAIMKLSVQPLIENYLIHGLRLERSDNQVKIEGKREENVLVITVSDNGNGISPEKLAEIEHKLQHAELNDHGSLGIQNVHNRLRIFYGEEAGLAIESMIDQGTVVTLKVPLQSDVAHQSIY